MEETIEGYVDHIIFRNQDNGYTVMVVVTEDEELTCVGSFQYMNEGETIKAFGHYTEHPSYGRQFVMSSYEVIVPQDSQAMERYLASGAVKGIGAALAARIVRRFKEDTLRIMEEEPERLAEVKGISLRKAQEISDQIVEKSDMRKAMMFLQQYGISLALGGKIYKQYGPQMYHVLKENPYQMAEDVEGSDLRLQMRLQEELEFCRIQIIEPKRTSLHTDAGIGRGSCLSSKEASFKKGICAFVCGRILHGKTYHGFGN